MTPSLFSVPFKIECLVSQILLLLELLFSNFYYYSNPAMNIFLDVACVCLTDGLEVISLEVSEVKLNREDGQVLEEENCGWVLVVRDSN